MRQLFLDYFQTAGKGYKNRLRNFCFTNQILSSVCRRQNVNKGLSSANHLATGNQQNDHYWRTLRRTALTGGTVNPRKSKKARNLAKIWLSCSSHCSPLDYFVLGVAKLDVNKSPQNNSDSLVHKMMEMMGNPNENTMAKACKRFMSRIEALVEADGNSLTNTILNTFSLHNFFTSIKSDCF